MDVTITPAAEEEEEEEEEEEFDRLPPTIQGRLIRVFERLKNFPAVSGVKPLRGKLAGGFRMRTGDYWAQFRVEGTRIVVEKVGHRDRFYED